MNMYMFSNQFLKKIRLLSISFLVVFSVVAVLVLAQSNTGKGKTVPTISVADVAKYVDQKVIVEGKVLRVGYSAKSNIYFLNFTPERGGFTVVIFDKVVQKFEQAKIDIRNFEGKVVQVTGVIKNPPKYGLEIILNDPTEIRSVIEEKAIKVPEISRPISVNEVAKYVNRHVTVEGKVLRVGHSTRSNTYFLNFTPERGGFTVVIFDRLAKKFSEAKINISAFEGQPVRVTGTISQHPQYGLQIILDEVENIKTIPP